jgi:MraZ protein
MRFTGEHPIKIDEKGRANIPKAYRELFAQAGLDRLVLTRYQVQGRPCLEALPPPVWEAFLEKFQQQSSLDPQIEVIGTFYVYPARELPLDSAGRVLIPQTQREWAKLDREAVVVGAVDRFRIWNAALWTETSADSAALAPDAFKEKAPVLR